jgi:short-chain Z-isoprenyl diphosphate synthase
MTTIPSNARNGLRGLVYDVYERRLVRKLKARHDPVPRHVGVILDGNRRWAKSVGATSKQGHQAGADKIEDLLTWCDDAGVEVVTLWLLSTDNLNRPDAELNALLGIIENVVTELARPENPWTLNVVGALDLLPTETARHLKEAVAPTTGRPGVLVNIAVCYGGRREIADAVRSLLQAHAAQGASIEEVAEVLDVDHIAEHLYTRGQPDPDLIIRTSGEQRLGGFMLWQSAASEYYFCEAYWPDFRHVDFLRALRDYGARQRRFGA